MIEKLLPSFAPFRHVTSMSRWQQIEQKGLDPKFGEFTFAGRGEPAVCLCTAETLEDAVRLAGTRYSKESHLAVIQVDVGALLRKKLGPDTSFERGLDDLEESLREGNLCCYELIRPEELRLECTVENKDAFIDPADYEDV